MQRLKSELARIIIISLGCICLFGGAYFVLSNFTLAMATNGGETLPPINQLTEDPAAAAPQDNPTQTTPQPSNPTSAAPPQRPAVASFDGINVFADTRQCEFPEAPAYAMGMYEAARLGAEYIYDVFGADITGYYFEMLHKFTGLIDSGFSQWIGFATAIHPYESPDAEGRRIRRPDDPVSFEFSIDAISGRRIDIARIEPSPPPTPERIETIMRAREWLSRQGGWESVSLDERRALVGLDDSTLAYYQEIALRLAEAHFNTGTVVDIALHEGWWAMHILAIGNEQGEYDFVLVQMNFLVTDDTGREAIVLLDTGHPEWSAGFTQILTVHE